MLMEHPIRVLLVDSSPLALKILQQILQDSPKVVVVGTAKHGREALRMLPTTAPEVICMAARLPVLDGPDLTREIMSQQACPILILTSEDANAAPANIKSELVAACLQAGAVDVFSMPSGNIASDSPQARSLIAKIKLLARVRVISRSSNRRTQYAAGNVEKIGASKTGETVPKKVGTSEPSASKLIAIGASTGGPQVLLAILSALPRDYPFPILCVQHISKGFISGLVDWLKDQCKVNVKIAVAGERPLPGIVYFPEDDHHLELDENQKIKLSSALPVDGHRPSVTALFTSLAKSQGERVVAILLTGMGSDGAQGLKMVHYAGGTTIVQDEETSVVFGMPAKAIELGVVQHVMPPNQIARHLLDLV